MFNMSSMYTREANILLKAVKETGLPIIVEGAPGTGASTLGEHLATEFDYAIIDGLDELNDGGEAGLCNLYKTVKENHNNDVVLVKRKQSKELLSLIGDHIKLKIFRTDGGERFFHIIPVTKMVKDSAKYLGAENPMVLVIGQGSDAFESEILTDGKSTLVVKPNEEELVKTTNEIIKAVDTLLEVTGKENYLDTEGSIPFVFKINLEGAYMVETYRFLETIKNRGSNLGIYVQAYATHLDAVDVDFLSLFNTRITL